MAKSPGAVVAEQLAGEAARVASWRMEEFVRLGFDMETAARLAGSLADLGVARKMVKDGCPLGLAARILED